MAPTATSENGSHSAISSSTSWSDENFTHIINGMPFEQKNAKRLEVINPATEGVVATVPIATKEVVDEAVKSSRDAFPAWSRLSWDERKAKIKAWHEESYLTLQKELIPLYTAEQGRTLQMAKIEFDITEGFWQLDKYHQPKDEVIEDDGNNKHILRKYPLGVSAALVPWNYPLVLTLWKVIPGLLSGNCVIVKPSPFTPLMTLKIIAAAQKHLPPGVLNVVVGDHTLGPLLTEHPSIDHISFTGSTQTGRLVAKSCASTLKRMTLELGGNDACIILPGIDIDQVALQVFISSMQNSGQFCAAAKRIYVHNDIFDEFASAYISIVKATKVGDGSDPTSGMGPVNNRIQFNKVNEFLIDIQNNNQKVLTGGEIHKGKGYFIPVTVVSDPPDDSKIVQEEPFGPVVPLLRFHSEQEVIKRANDTRMGLGGQVWGPFDQAERIADQLETGTVWVNQMQSFNPLTYFGGWKDSGIGGANGRQGVESFMQSKTLRLAKNVKPYPG